VYDIQSNERNRSSAITAINDGTIDGIIMTAQTGGCGHNMPGAQIMIFMSSLYSPAEENQSICMLHSIVFCLIVGRMCREGQMGIPKAFIIGDSNFKGDATAFRIKEDREKEEIAMQSKLSAVEVRTVLDKVSALRADDETFKSWKRTDSDLKFQKFIEERKALVAEKAASASTDQNRSRNRRLGADEGEKKNPIMV
jgi:hypothetical protein